MKYIFLFFLCLFSFAIKAQNITVFDQSSKEPIAGVAVYNSSKSKSATSDVDGVVCLDLFLENEKLFFQHISYIKTVYTKSKIGKEIFLKSKSQDLEEIVVSTSKFEQNKKEIAQKITNIKSETVALTNPQTSADLLKSSGYVFIQKSQLGGGSPIIRGFSTNRLSLIVDGVRFNNAIFRGGNVQNVISIDPFSVQNSEVTLGPGAVIYGSDAIGGVINFYSLKPKLSEIDNFSFNGNAAIRYASASNENTGHLDFNLGYKKWAFLTSVSYTNFDDLRAGGNGPDDFLRPDFVQRINNQDVIVTNDSPRDQISSGYDQINFLQKVHYKASDRLSFDLGLHYTTTSDYDRYDRLIRRNSDGQLRSAEWFFGPQRWFSANFQVTKLSSSSNLYDKIKFTSAYQNFQESRNDRNFNATNRRIREENVDALSANIDFEKTVSNRSKLSYGAEYVYNLVNSEARQLNIFTDVTSAIATRYPDGSSWESFATYINYKYKPNTKLTFQSGLRYNHIFIDADLSGNNDFFNFPFEDANLNTGALTGGVGISWSPNNIFHWKLNASTAFRAPNIDDIGRIFDSEAGSVVVPNADLKSEYAYSGELGLTLNFDGRVILDLSSYYTYLDDALIRRDFNLNGETQILFDGELSNVQAIQNASRSNIYGFEAGIKIHLSKNLNLTSQYNIIRGNEEDASGVREPVRHVAPDFGNTHLIWEKNKIKLDAYLEYNATLSFDELAPSQVANDFLFAKDENGNPFAPSWYTLNLRSQYQISDQLSLTGTIENITNQLYRQYSSGISAPGLNAILALRYKL
ncbi:TonB-dependent receptor [Flavobacteriaceae bacterium AU392]|nr:TonB-dependent receptor [Flavobacteriaceae bacterium]RKM84683.1 TonB-dependent receptor [Flavobacteriaceae bacterium AU392]